MNFKDKALPLLLAGFEPIPLHGKRPYMDNWQEMLVDKESVTTWTANGHGNANVGIRCNDIHGLDVDVTCDKTARKIAAWLDNTFNNGQPLPRRFGKAPKFLIPCTIPGITQKHKSTEYLDQQGNTNAIEVLSKGQQFVVYGIHPDTQQAYRWVGKGIEDIGFMGLPEFNEYDIVGMFFDYFDELAQANSWTKVKDKKKKQHKNSELGEEPDPFSELKLPTAQISELKEALALLPQWVVDDRDEWVKVGGVCHFETQGTTEGYNLWDKWSQNSPKYVSQCDTKRVWDSYNLEKTGDDLATFSSLFTYEETFGTEVAYGGENQGSKENDDVSVGNNSHVTLVTPCYTPVTHSVTHLGEPNFENKSITFRISEFLTGQEGHFTNATIYQEFSLKSRADKTAARMSLMRLVKDNVIERTPGMLGGYRTVDTSLDRMKLEKTLPPEVDLPLPLDLPKHTRVLQGSVIVISGSTNAGKTSFALRILHDFCQKCNKNQGPIVRQPPLESLRSSGLRDSTFLNGFSEIRYLNSEMSAAELGDRLRCFGEDAFQKINSMTQFIKRPRDWGRAVAHDGLNFVDYMQIYDDFYQIGQFVNEIHEKLTTGICIILIQKKAGEDNPRGGEFALEKARLALSLDSNIPHGQICKIRKLKHPIDFKKNKQGYEIDFEIGGDVAIKPISQWRVMNKKERAKINARYEKEKLAGDFVEVQL